MRAIKITILFVLGVLTTSFMYAKDGAIRGKVIDDASGEVLYGALIEVEGTENGTVTDFEGVFNLTLKPGVYNLKVSNVSYETLVINDIEVKEGEVFIIDQIRLKEAQTEIEEVVVTASEIRNTDAALYTVKMKSVNLIDGISSSSLKKIGDSDAASSMKRVPGVSVQSGKYVYVRGLGDRYSKTMLNGVDVPGLDPDKNTIQMDIFPTNIIDNLIVHKSFSAELPADFTGGVIDIQIRDFPEERDGSISISTGYNANYHFKSDYLTYEGGSKDWLGFDDGTREIPATDNIPEYTDVFLDPYSEDGQRYSEILGKFSPTMAAMEAKSFMDYGIGLSYGNQHSFKKITIGYTIAASYKNNTEFFKDAEFGRYAQETGNSIIELVRRDYRIGNYGVSNVFASGLAGVAVKTKNSKFRIYAMHLQNGESKAGIFDYEATDLGTTIDAYQHALTYSQRSLSNALIDGKHSFAGGNWEVEWKFSPTISKMTDPDIRFTRYAYQPDGVTLVISPESGYPERNWRFLEERDLAGVVHLTKSFNFNGSIAKLKFGGAYTNKNRNYSILGFQIIPKVIDPDDIILTGDPNELFWEENLWPVDGNGRIGTTIRSTFHPSKEYNAVVDYYAGYVSVELNLLSNLKSIFGVRYEKFEQYFTGQDQEDEFILNNDKVLDDQNFFPSINFVYSLGEKQNLRLSYSQTIARPSMKEVSYISIYDPISGITFNGSLAPIPAQGRYVWDGDIQSTTIQNFDLRWEMFERGGQMISVSAFYKMFDKPIEYILSATGQKLSYQARNVGDGQLFGAEIEFRQSLDLITPSLKQFMLMTNFSYIKSRVKLSDIEYELKEINARDGETISEYRDMAGMSPYIINAGLSYNGGKNGFLSGFEAGLYYNVQGKAIHMVGIGVDPNVYAKPFHSLNFNSSKRFGKKKNFSVGIKIDNILNSEKEYVWSAYKAEDQYFEHAYLGRKFELKLGYSF